MDYSGISDRVALARAIAARSQSRFIEIKRERKRRPLLESTPKEVTPARTNGHLFPLPCDRVTRKRSDHE